MKEKKVSRPLLAILLSLVVIFYFATQQLIGTLLPPMEGIGDRPQMWLDSVNAFLQANTFWANVLLTMYSGFGDIATCSLIAVSIAKGSSRHVLPLFAFILLRQLMQLAVSLPTSPDVIWHDPGFPSLFSNYAITGDFYFSAYIGIDLLAAFEWMTYKRRWMTTLGFAVVAFEIFAALALRLHYTPDIYTSIMTAIFCHFYVVKLSPYVTKLLSHIHHYRREILSLSMVAVGAFFFVTEHLIGLREIPSAFIVDRVHNLLYPINRFLAEHPLSLTVLLFSMNMLLNALSLFVLGLSVVTRNVRPCLVMFCFFLLRQTLQLFVSFPIPDHILWDYPGLPDSFDQFATANDFYFSGHTGVALIAALEFARFKTPWLTRLGYAFVLFEMIGVATLQVHYTMDIFTAIVTVYCLEIFSKRVSPTVNHLLAKIPLFH